MLKSCDLRPHEMFTRRGQHPLLNSGVRVSIYYSYTHTRQRCANVRQLLVLLMYKRCTTRNRQVLLFENADEVFDAWGPDLDFSNAPLDSFSASELLRLYVCWCSSVSPCCGDFLILSQSLALALCCFVVVCFAFS